MQQQQQQHAEPILPLAQACEEGTSRTAERQQDAAAAGMLQWQSLSSESKWRRESEDRKDGKGQRALSLCIKRGLESGGESSLQVCCCSTYIHLHVEGVSLQIETWRGR